jgi:hypothetical protein
MGFKYKNFIKDATLPVALQPVKNLINLILAFRSLKEKIFQTKVFRMTRKNEPTKILEYYHGILISYPVKNLINPFPVF